MIEKDLQAVGLYEKEAQVYLAALELGRGTVQHIAQKSGLKRPTTYVVIEELMNQGLISSFYEGKKQYFVAENPDRLADMLHKQSLDVEKRKEQLDMLLPQLQSLNNRQTDKPVVKYYEGKEGILAMVKEHTLTSHGKMMRSVYNRDVIAETFGESVLKSLVEARVGEDVQSRIIYTWSKGDFQDPANTESVHVNASDLPMSCDIAIYEDKIRIASFKNRLVGVVIEDREIAKSFKAIYDLAWKWVQSQKHS